MSDEKDMICEMAGHSFYVKGFSTWSQSLIFWGVVELQCCGLVIKNLSCHILFTPSTDGVNKISNLPSKSLPDTNIYIYIPIFRLVRFALS